VLKVTVETVELPLFVTAQYEGIVTELEASKVTESPGQIVVAVETIVALGIDPTVTVTVAVLEQPAAVVPVTV
jgi:hypothetical protein